MNMIIETIFFHNADRMLKAYRQGYEKEYFSTQWTLEDTKLLNRVQNNLFAFSGAKTYAQMTEMRDAVYKNGELLSLADFKREARKINRNYNIHYLDAERHHVMAAGTGGSRWLDFQETKDTHPYLEYVTARDERVRENHRTLDGIVLPIDDPFWNQYLPPNGWRCRCFVRKLTQRMADHKTQQYNNRKPSDPMPSSDEAQRMAGRNVAKPFRHNVGTTDIFERDGHPYFKANKDAKELQLSAVKHYGMNSVAKIYGNPSRLASYKGSIANKEEFANYWQKLEKQHGDGNGGFTLTDRKNNIQAHFDHKLMEKMIERDRHTYFDEVTNVFFNPDEVWGSIQGGRSHHSTQGLFNIYIKYYNDKPVVLLVDSDGEVSSMYRWDRGLDDSEKFRVGLLKHKR